MTPYYQDDLVTIYHGDCREVMADPNVDNIDLVFTSPPYNLGTTSGGGFGRWKGAKWDIAALDYDAHDDAMPTEEYEAWQRAVLWIAYDRLTDRGAIFYNHKPRVQNGLLWLPLSVNPELPLRQIIVWARAGGMNYAPTHYVPTHEWIMVFAKPAFRLKSKAASGLGDVWRVPQDADNPHPAPFPVALPARAIETTAPGLVLDPFMGSGSTLVAAKAAGVSAIGIEISERYCEMAARRCSQEVLGLVG